MATNQILIAPVTMKSVSAIPFPHARLASERPAELVSCASIRWARSQSRQLTWRNVMRVQVSVADKIERFAAGLAQPGNLQGLQIARRHDGHGQYNRRSQD